MLRIAVLVSGGGTNLQAIMDAIDAGEIRNTQIAAVISNNAGAYALERAKNHGIEAVCVSPKDYEDRETFNRALVDKVDSYQVDLVVLAGDIFDNEYEAIKDPDKVAAILGEMESTYGTYACWGNHDVSEKILAGFTFDSGEAQEEDERFLAFLDKARVNLLEDEGVLIDDAFYLFGRKDPSKALKMGEDRLPADQVTDGMDKDKPIIVIDHQPLELAELAAAGVDVDLSGHTHNGQIFPGNILLKFLWENPYGIEDKDGMYSCVTSGAGLWGPAMRIGTDCEIMLLDIQFGTENTLAE